MTADHDGMEDAVAAYLLGACPDDERAAVRAHLRSCRSCRELARRLREAVDVLALSCAGQPPPPGLRRRILEAAASAVWNIHLQQELDRRPPSYAMQGTGPMAGARGSVTGVDSGQVTLVSFSALPSPPPGRVYEVWLVLESGRVVSAGAVRPDARGDAHVLVQRPLSGVQVVSVTQEQAPGSSRPSGKPLMAAQVGR